jgi:hypothetical protein
MRKRGFRRGQGESRTTLLLIELVIVLVVLASLYFLVQDKEAVVGHSDLDNELLVEALTTFPSSVELVDTPKILSEGETNA